MPLQPLAAARTAAQSAPGAAAHGAVPAPDRAGAPLSARALLLAASALLGGCSALIISVDSSGAPQGVAPLEQVAIAWNPVGERRVAGHRAVSRGMEPFQQHDVIFERIFAPRLTPRLAARGVTVVPAAAGVPTLLVGVAHRPGGCRGACGTFITYGGMLYREPARPLWTVTIEQRADTVNADSFDAMLDEVIDTLASDGLLPR